MIIKWHLISEWEIKLSRKG